MTCLRTIDALKHFPSALLIAVHVFLLLLGCIISLFLLEVLKASSVGSS